MRSGGSVLEAPPGAEEGALPRKREPVQPLNTTNPRKPHSPASVNRYNLSKQLTLLGQQPDGANHVRAAPE